jgi:hypothetical protein
MRYVMGPPPTGEYPGEDLAALQQDLQRAMRRPVRFLHPDGRLSKRPHMIGRAKWARLRAQRRIDRACAWLCGHGMTRTARAIWRATGSAM